MRKRRVYVVLMAGVVLVGGVVVASSEEPIYKNKWLSEWVVPEAFRASQHRRTLAGHDLQLSEEANDAIRQIGTNALPYLLKWIQYQPPRTMTSTQKNPYGEWEMHIQEDARARGAVAAFRALGAEASTAIPELTRLMTEQKPTEVAMRASKVLGFLGTNALPPLISVLTNHQRGWDSALTSIVSLGTNARPAVPVLIAMLRETNLMGLCAAMSLYDLKIEPSVVIPALTSAIENQKSFDRVCQMMVLRKYGPEARAAVPTLLRLLNDPDSVTREAATNVLQAIDPKALERATR